MLRQALARFAAALFAMLAVVFFSALPALAADGTTADIGPLLQLALEIAGLILGPVILLLVHKALAYGERKLGVKLDDSARATIDTAISRGLGNALHTLDLRLAAGMPVDVRNQVIAAAVTYAAPKIPDAMARFGIDEKGLAERVAGELMQMIGPDPLASQPPAQGAPAAPAPAQG